MARHVFRPRVPSGINALEDRRKAVQMHGRCARRARWDDPPASADTKVLRTPYIHTYGVVVLGKGLTGRE